jgi:LysM repeat protein
LLFLLLGIYLAGCTFGEDSQVVVRESVTPTSGKLLTPYHTKTPGHKVPSKTPALNPTEIPLPTLTPFIYEVVENDTLTSIAFRHSVSLEELVATNPGIDPNFLAIGTKLTIPLQDGAVSSGLPTATPVSVLLQQPVCYPVIDVGIQCMVVVENDHDFAVENVSVIMSLRTGGNDPVSQTAITPLNLIPAGKNAAVISSFPLSRISSYSIHATLLSAIPISTDDQRYLKNDLEIQRIQISSDGMQAKVIGEVKVLSNEVSVGMIWISAFAYDAQNEIVGIRKMVASDDFFSNDRYSFDLFVYSLGRAIDHVDVFAEVRP